MPHTCKSGLELAAPFVRRDLRRAARAWQLGRDYHGRPLAAPVQLTETDEVSKPAVSVPKFVDDAAIYFRCGDILRYAHHAEYGWVRYSVYKRELDPATKSIGIITVPQNVKTCRKNDCGHLHTCQRLAEDLKGFLQGAFPAATVTLRNQANETVLGSYARLVLAKQMICNPSTFCMLPAVASQGQGIVVYSQRLYPWVTKAAKAEGSQLKVLNDTFLSMKQVVGGHMNVEKIVKWLRA